MEAVKPFLKPKTLLGARMEYTLCEKCLVITDTNQADTAKRKIEVPREMLGRFISELQEIERIALEEA